MRAGAMSGYEQLCIVDGHMRTGATTHSVSGLGQRGHTWGAPDWSRLELTRSVSAWLGPDVGGVTLSSVRDAGANAHPDEAVWAALAFEGDPVKVLDPRLSTTYDGEGRQRRAGLELWVNEEDDYPSAPPGRSSADRRSTSASCAWTSRSSAGTPRATRASAATT